MNSHEWRLFFNLIAPAFAGMVLGGILISFAGASADTLLSHAARYIGVAGLGVMLMGLLSTVVVGIRMGLHYTGRGGEPCSSCGGPLRLFHTNGRYGPYHHCMQCGANQALR